MFRSNHIKKTLKHTVVFVERNPHTKHLAVLYYKTRTDIIIDKPKMMTL